MESFYLTKIKLTNIKLSDGINMYLQNKLQSLLIDSPNSIFLKVLIIKCKYLVGKYIEDVFPLIVKYKNFDETHLHLLVKNNTIPEYLVQYILNPVKFGMNNKYLFNEKDTIKILVNLNTKQKEKFILDNSKTLEIFNMVN